MLPRYKKGDKVKYTNCYGFTHEYYVTCVHQWGTDGNPYFYDLTIAKKDGSIPKRRIDPLDLKAERWLKPG